MNHNETAPPKRTLTAITVDLKAGLLARVGDAFERGNVELVTIPAKQAEEHKVGRAQACFLPLNVESVQSAGASSWFVPRQTVLYGLGCSEDAARFGYFGINALLNLEDELSVRAAVDTTRNLLCRNLDERSRIPIVVAVRIETEHGVAEGLTRNIGCGGMAVRLSRACSLPLQVNLAFQLPQDATLSVAAVPRWYSGSLVGFQFPASSATSMVKRWVFRYSRLACCDAVGSEAGA
jgi:PilZ domain